MKRILFLGLGPITIEMIKTLQVMIGLFSIEAVSMWSRRNDLPGIHLMKPIEWLNLSGNTNYDFVINSWRDSEMEVTRNLIIDKLLSNSSCQFLFLSSVAVYGECDKPKNELSLASPINSYGNMKYHLECKFRDLCLDRVTSLRISNVFGNRGFKDFINLVTKSAKDQNTIQIDNPALITRDFISQEKVVEVILAIIQEANSFRIENHNILNVSSGVSYSLDDVINYLKFNFNLNIRSSVVPPSYDTILNSRIDNSLLRHHFDIELKDPLEYIGAYFNEFSSV